MFVYPIRGDYAIGNWGILATVKFLNPAGYAIMRKGLKSREWIT